ncbi:hypothetical protein PENANT_c068G02198 [Penicillium antarcticum]|uniref:Uncharacterized protein n=1 Tax=Penicillium antarcticum TaxID=416450 RepID=A0A1V6PR19_9EURO|nr:hypothetical protein PENANT_c068G02198 [Penicillium antarcticum]
MSAKPPPWMEPNELVKWQIYDMTTFPAIHAALVFMRVKWNFFAPHLGNLTHPRRRLSTVQAMSVKRMHGLQRASIRLGTGVFHFLLPIGFH